MVTKNSREKFENNKRDLTRIVNTYLKTSKAFVRDLRRVDMNRDNFREKVEETVLSHTPDRDKSMWLKALKYDTNARFVVKLVKEKVSGRRAEPFEEFTGTPTPRVKIQVPRPITYKVNGSVRRRQKPIHYSPMQERLLRTQIRLGKTARNIQVVFNTRNPDEARNFGAMRSKVYRVRRSLRE